MRSPSPDASARGPKVVIGVLYGFRALMVFFVCNYHVWQQGWLGQYFDLWGVHIDFDYFTRSGYLFVDGMMLLSGFLLYLPYAGTGPVPSARRFYFNRVARILPSYLLALLAALALLPTGAYSDAASLNRDLLTHLTFTFTFWPQTYLYTPLNGVLWTVAVEMQFYLLFPWLAKLARRKPAWTLSTMAALGWLYRAFVYYRATNTAFLLNQLPSFLDVYALGMLGAMIWTELECKRKRAIFSWLMVPAFAISCWVLCELLHTQSLASMEGHAALRLSQLRLRLPFALTMLAAMLSASQAPKLLQRLLDNRLTRMLAAISFNLYLWHQMLSVRLAQNLFPDTLHADRPLQLAYTLLCHSLSILVAMLVTFGFEQPVTRLAHRMRLARGKKENHERP